MMIRDENNSIFQLASDFVNQTSEHLFLTGKAGTGKTTFLKYIREHTHKSTIVAAPTGVAAINAGGVTLHSLFQLPLEPYIPGYSTVASKKNFFRFSKQKLDLLRQLELLIIDEVSMLRADILDSIDTSLRSIRRNSRPFGGVQMLYIGDLFQLPPVAKEDEWNLLKDYYKSTFFFHAHVIQQTKPIYLELKKVYRQGDPVFVDLLNRVRNNIITTEDIQRLNELYDRNFVPDQEEGYIILTTHNYKADNINNVRLAELPGEERIFAGEVTGDFPSFALPTDIQLRLKPGAQIMFLKNDVDEHRYFNGKIGVISHIIADQIHVYLSDTNDTIILKKETWENKRFELDKISGKIKEETLGSFSQYPIRLAWAITIHKSQGLTFEKAIIDLGSSFAAGQAYVALSRCTSLDGIVLYSKIHPNCIMTDDQAIEFSQNEKTEQDLLQLFRRGKRKFWTDRLLLYFDWKPMYNIIRQIEKLLEEKEGNEYLPAKMLVADYKRKVRELEDITLKFQNQLIQIIQKEETDSDISLLKERCQKAVGYYHQNVVSQILIPLQNYIQSFKVTKKNKTFHKNMILVEEDIFLFLENMKKVRYNNIALTEDLELNVPKRKELFEGKK
ncbi:MAG: AAA family ATPase [Candidatus Symbiothrix sp.]|jgi:energy-coupling factor transporter ATP-binding protein EcfA2|nr:AAA family ATPase [Candidatus Symbiothrix sp.]